MATQWTAEQLKILNFRGGNMLVSAAAGSGKTAVLVERIIKMVLDEKTPMDIDKILVVTFTNAAAAQMRDRISTALEEALYAASDNIHLQRQLSLIHKAQITTIHSFCLDIIKKHFSEIGLDSAFRVLDEDEKKIIVTKTLENVYEENYRRQESEFLQLMATYSDNRSEDELSEVILKIYNIANSYPNPQEWLDYCVKQYTEFDVKRLNEMSIIEDMFDYIKLIINECKEQLEPIKELCLEWQSNYLEAILSDEAMLQRLGECKNFISLYEESNNIEFVALSRKKDKLTKPEKEQIKALRENVKNNINKLFKDYLNQPPEHIEYEIKQMTPVVIGLINLVTEFNESYKQAKRENRLIDFNDFEHMALQILVKNVDNEGNYEPSEIAINVANQFDEIMIDEYQDSSSIQEALLTSISKEKQGTPNIFMVGDVKQSIYKFRLAKPELFLKKYDTYIEDDESYNKIELRKNFRSRGEILKFTNFVCSQIMAPSLGGIDYNESVELNLGANFPLMETKNNRNVEILLLNDDTEEKTEQEEKIKAREYEAIAIAQKIKELVKGENPYQVFDKELKAYRNANYSDIVILLRSLTGWDTVLDKVLTAQGIPICIEAGKGYFDKLEIVTLINLLKIIDNPRQDIPLCAVLNSPFVDMSTEDIAIFRIVDKRINLYDAILQYIEQPKNEALAKKASKFIEFLSSLRTMATYCSVSELLKYIIYSTDYLNYITAMPEGERRRGNVEMLLTKVDIYEEKGNRGVFDFIRYLDNVKEYSIEAGEPNITGDNENIVRVMTIHKSKGLEFPIAIVGALGKRFNKRDLTSRTIIHTEKGIGIDYIDSKKMIKKKSLSKKIIAKQIDLENVAEELRIFYVACTRAKEKLILTGHCGHISTRIDKNISEFYSIMPKLRFSTVANAISYLDLVFPCLIKNKCMSDIMKDFGKEKSIDCLEYFKDICADITIIDEKQLDKYLAQIIISDHFTKEELIEKLEKNEAEESPLLSEAYLWKYSYQSAISRKIKATVTELKKQAYDENAEDLAHYEIKTDKEALLPKFIKNEVRPQGAEYGTLIHRLFEVLDFTHLSDEKEVELQLEELVQKGVISEEEKALVNSSIFTQFAKTNIGKQMIMADKQNKLRKEQPFVIGVPIKEMDMEAESDDVVMVQGVIDAYYELEGELAIVDYKTDKATAEELVIRYAAQLQHYKKALEMLTEKKVCKCVIFSTRLMQEIIVV